MSPRNPVLRALPIPLPRPCPGCTEKEKIIRGLADILSGAVGGYAGGLAGTAYGGPAYGLAGAEIGQEAAPYLIEAAAMEIAGLVPKVKRKASAYSKKFGRAFKKIQKKHKAKSGCWKKGGYRRCVKEAHKIAKRMR